MVGRKQRSRSVVAKVNDTLDYPLQTDVAASRLIGRDYKTLLRSTGHHFRDGRWLGDDDPFHVYREIENPGLGALRNFQGSQYFVGYDPSYPQFGPQQTFNWRPGVSRGYEYAFWNDVYSSGLPDPVDPSYSDYVLDLNAKGTSFIRRFRPGNPVGSLGQFVGELHDLPRLPLLFRSRAKHFRDIGSEYLNVEFGWRPFVEDVIKLGHTQLRMASLLDDLIKKNGIRTKRRSKHEVVTTGGDLTFHTYDRPFTWLGHDVDGDVPELTDYYSFGPYNSGVDSNITGELELSLDTRRVTETWFVGTFTYYVPDIGSSRWTDKSKAILQGGLPTPSVLYQVYPWTWLADWFANVGDIVSNLSTNAVDSEVFEDCHIMETITDRFEIDCHLRWDYHQQDIGGVPYVAIAPGADHIIYSLIKKQKIRQHASPFGFGLKYDEFSIRQKSILAALLFSKKSPNPRIIGLR